MTLSPETKPDGCARGVPLKDGKRDACHQRVKIAASHAPKIRAMASTPRPSRAALPPLHWHARQQIPKLAHVQPNDSGAVCVEVGLSPLEAESPLTAHASTDLSNPARKFVAPPTIFMRSPK